MKSSSYPCGISNLSPIKKFTSGGEVISDLKQSTVASILGGIISYKIPWSAIPGRPSSATSHLHHMCPFCCARISWRRRPNSHPRGTNQIIRWLVIRTVPRASHGRIPRVERWLICKMMSQRSEFSPFWCAHTGNGKIEMQSSCASTRATPQFV